MRALFRLALALSLVFVASSAARSQNPCLLDGFCTPATGENCENCKQDCCPDTYCGDLICQPDEEGWCQLDCQVMPTCGDGLCDYNEDAETCMNDCTFICNDGICEWGEHMYCPQDCPQ